MPEKKINLEEALSEIITTYYKSKAGAKIKLLEFSKQLLELASENAEITISDENGNWDYPDINKQSILDTIKQIEIN